MAVGVVLLAGCPSNVGIPQPGGEPAPGYYDDPYSTYDDRTDLEPEDGDEGPVDEGPPDDGADDDDGPGPIDEVGLPPCEPGTARLEPVTVFAVAPLGMDNQHLGRPLTRDFQLMAGEEGRTLFPEGRVTNSALDAMEHRTMVMESKRQVAANIGYFGIGAEVGRDTTRRHAIYSAYELEEVREIDDTSDSRQAPQDAIWYLWRIHYGHSFQALVSGDETRFHAGVKARFGVVNGSISTFTGSNSLELTASGRGLEPRTGDALFARTENEILDAYSTTGEAVPIFVEYRTVPTACVPDDEPITWIDPVQVTLRYDTVEVYEDGSWGRDTWSLDARCVLDGAELWLDNPWVWDMHGDVCDDDQGGQGPQGDGDFCSYNLGWQTSIEAIAGQTLTCGVQGMAWDDGNEVEYSEFSWLVGDPAVSGRMGAGNGQTEYWLYYTLLLP